jgi:hypothetical protein
MLVSGSGAYGSCCAEGYLQLSLSMCMAEWLYDIGLMRL